MTQKCGANKLAKLRELMKSISTSTDGSKRKGIQAFIVHTTDAHQSEYLREHDRRLQFISGFTGSLGTAIITYDKALLWTDGRYFNQALKEFDPPEAWTLMKEPLPETPTRGAWLVSNLPPKSVVGADPNLLSSNEWLTLQNNLTASGHCLLPLYENLVDKVWSKDQPEAVYNAIVPQPLEYTGRTAGEKVRSCLEAMKQNKCTALVFEALDEVAYLLNWRGSDIPYNPVFFAYVILTPEELHLFVNINMVSPEAKEQLVSEGVNPIYHPYEEIHDFLKTIASVSGQKIWIPSDSSYSIVIDCGTAGKYSAITPIALMKVIKTDVEIKGMKAAHVRDSVALVKYFAWLEDKVQNTDECITEISGAERLLRFRQEQELFVGPSFTTISSVGPHGAIIHYQPTPETDVQITDKEMYLCDSGAQYKDGTTDITRTWHFGTPTNYERECFTRVFKGQSHLSTLIFPSKTKGNILHSLTRESLWSAGLDFLHGTGHGVGSYLNVHELLVLISWKPNPYDPGLQAGMFISNEPGYYEDNNFGIRLENIELIVEAKTPYNFMNNKFVTFETVSLVPIQKSLLDTSLLTDPEIEYLNNYHAKCYKVLQPFLQGAENAQALQWLEKVTQPLYREMKTQK